MALKFSITMMKGTLTFLGTGASAGVPLIACNCRVCTSENPYNKRLRPSALIEIHNKKILIDSGPDFREQALKFFIHHLDGIIYTHTHYDHIAGIDELRVYYLNTKEKMGALVSKKTYLDIQKRYSYLFEKPSSTQSLTAQLHFNILPSAKGMINFLEIPIQYMYYSQGGMEVTGYRFGNLAYISDIKNYDLSIFDDLKNLKTLIISAVSHKASYMHMNLDEAIEFSKHCNAQEVWITHISHTIDHEETNRSLPQGIQLAYDGLRLPFEY